MKNFRFIALATLICMAMQIQVAQADELSKEEKKAIQEQLDSIMYNEAVKAVNDTMFTLEASRATFKTGYTINVTSSTNFITVKKGKASIQTAFNASISGANGMGGVTVDGTISNYRISTDKKSGDTMVSMSVLGVGISVPPKSCPASIPTISGCQAFCCHRKRVPCSKGGACKCQDKTGLNP